LSSAVAVAKGTRTMAPACNATIVPNAPSCTASIAAIPKRVARTRSNAVGVPPALNVTEHGDARVEAGALADLLGEHVADTAEPHVTELVGLAGGQHDRALLRLRAFGDDDDRCVATLLVTLDEVLAHPLDVEFSFRHEHLRRTACDPRVDGDPSGMTAHDLADQHSVVRLGGGVQPVDGIHGDLHRGVEPEGHLGAAEIVVDRLRHAHDVDAVLGQLRSDAEGVLAADRHERVDAEFLQRRLDRVGTTFLLVGVRARAAQDRSAPWEDAPAPLNGQGHGRSLDHALPAVLESDELVAVDLLAFADDGADDRVEAGAVAPAGEHSDAHGSLLSRLLILGDRAQP